MLMSTVKKRLNEIADIITTEKAFYWLIMITMISLPVMELLVEQHSRNFEGQPIIVEAAGIAGVVMVVTRFIKNKNSIRFYPTDLFYFLLVIFAGLSLAFTENMLASVQGYDYDEWLTHFMAYFSLMYAGTMIEDKKLRKNILKAFIFVLLIQGIVGVLQSFGYEFTNCFFDGEIVTDNHWAYGLTPHFNWYSALMTLASGCTMGLAIFAKERRGFVTYLILSAIGVYAMLATETRLALVSLAVLIVFFPISLIIFRIIRRDTALFGKEMLRWFIITLMIIGMFAVLLFGFGRFKSEISDTINEINAISEQSDSKADENEKLADTESKDALEESSETSENSYINSGFFEVEEHEPYFADDTAVGHFANNRGHIWRYGLACVPDHLFFGVGLDNYRWCFTHAPDLPHNTWTQGKGHNELIHYLVTQGLLQLLTILALYGYTIIVGVRTVLKTEDNERRIMTWTFLAMFTAYVVQSMFNSSVVNIAPYFWITIGMVLCKDDQRPFGYRKSLKDTNK